MYKANINKKQTLTVSQEKGRLLINNVPVTADVKELSEDSFHVLNIDGKSFNAEILDVDPAHKTAIVIVNGNKYTVELKDKYDELLHSLGMDVAGTHKMNDLKAPMPGLVLKVLVKEGDEVKKDDALLVLEAMKMENIIKASAEGVIKTIKVKEKDTCEKNQVLITFK